MRIIALLGILCSVLLAGCASYHMGQPTELPYREIEVAPPRNLSTLPQFEGPLAAALRQGILQESALSLASGPSADAVLEVTVLEIEREIAAVTAEDVGRGRKFELRVMLSVDLARPGQMDDYFFQGRVITVSQDIFTDDGLVDSEYQATPEVSRQVAVKVVEMLTDLW